MSEDVYHRQGTHSATLLPFPQYLSMRASRANSAVPASTSQKEKRKKSRHIHTPASNRKKHPPPLKSGSQHPPSSIPIHTSIKTITNPHQNPSTNTSLPAPHPKRS
ncbi:hypothetical protein B0O99DRAFT_360316 [Bisporella sp. PMI_857]|nr:hypothetical protein B0O99DRAFT_360316 [Bisporella sp. PMI_857]